VTSRPAVHGSPAEPQVALRALAEQLRSEDSVISPHVVASDERPELGLLAAAGARAARAPGEYALLVESVREGYLLHYARPRLLAGHDADLALLAGDYLYARGIERLALLGDADAVHELSDLISLAAQCHAEGRPELATPLWLATAVAVGCGAHAAHEAGKAAARRLDPGAAERLWEGARRGAASAGLESDLDRAAQSIDFAPRRANTSG
jgi:hypothetical protein